MKRSIAVSRLNGQSVFKPKFAICRIVPANYVHGAAFDEVVTALQCALERLGYTTRQVVNDLPVGYIPIIIGAHLLPDADLRRLSAQTIIYNLEQLEDNSIWLSEPFIAALGRCVIWDFSRRNLEEIAQRTGNIRLHYLPPGYVSELTCIKSAPLQDIDVLFYGSVNERRARILEQLSAAGLKVEAVFGAYGEQRNQLISRAKVVLNLHYYNSRIFEIVRVFHLLANGKAVVAECDDQTEIDQALCKGVQIASYDKLTDACVKLVRDDELRRQLEITALDTIRNYPMEDALRPLVEKLSLTTLESEQKMTMPRKLNMGSGKDWRADYVNVDITPRVGPDLVLDFSHPLPWGERFETERFGEVTLQPDLFDLIIANDVLEHIPDLITAMTSCLALLCEGGEMHVQVPYDLSYGAWQDPTHVRAFNEKSWLYYTDWFWYLGWDQARFDLVEHVAVLSPLGKRLQSDGKSMEIVMLTPRAVDALHVKLRKRLLSVDEKAQVKQMRESGR